MALFYKRPLACACACLIAVMAVLYFAPLFVSLLLGIVLSGLALILFSFCLWRGFSYPKLFLLLVVLAISFGAFRIYFDQRGNERENALSLGQSEEAEAVIEEILYQNTYGAEYLVRVERLGEENISGKAVLRLESASPFGVGDRICGEFLLESLQYEAYHENAASDYFSKGAKFLLLCEDMQTLDLVQSGTHTLSSRLARLRAVTAFRISDTVGGEEGKLLAAILLGTKNNLSDATVRDFRLSGVSHLLALSGLHLMILVGLIDRLLYLLHASKRTRITVVLPLCLFYFLLTGCNYSLLRAMLMLGAVYFSFLLREDNDALTALFLSAATILCVTPYALFSLSFQMTMLATLGILAYAKFQAPIVKLFPKGKGRLRFVRWLARGTLLSLLITLTTTLCLLPVLWLTLGSYSLMTPLANLLLVPIAPALLFGAVLVLVLPFAPIGTVVAPIVRLVLYLSRFFASFDLMLTLRAAYVPYIMIPLIVLSALLLVLDLKQRYFLSLLPLALSVLAFATVIPIAHHMDRGKLEVGYRHSGKNEGLVLVQNTSAVICDVSGASLTQWRADWYTAQEMGATRLEVLMLTHYHSKSAVALSRFSQSAMIHALWLPQPQNEEEEEILLELLDVALAQGLNVTLYARDSALTVFESGRLSVSAPLWHSRSAEPAFSLEISFGAKTLCYHTAALSEYLRAQQQTHACRGTHLILGAHGPVPHDDIEIPMHEGLADVALGSERALSFLQIREGLRYLLSPERYIYTLK